MSLGSIFTTILYEPLFNALMFLYQILGSQMGLAIIALTILIRVILIYPSLAQIKAQRNLQEMQPKLKKLQEKHKNDKEAYSRAVLDFYKQNKVNPFSSCLPLLIQFPILIALYQVFIGGLTTDAATGLIVPQQLDHLYASLRDAFATTPIHTNFIGFDLAAKQNIILAVLAAAATFWQAHMLIRRRPPAAAGSGARDEGQLASMNRISLYVMPAVTLIFALTFPAGLALYWLVTTLFQVGQQFLFLRSHTTQAETPQPAA